MRSLLVAAVVLILACTDRPPAAVDDGLCANVLRVPAPDVDVMTLDENGKPARVAVECERVGCLRARADAVAVVQKDGTVWAAWAGREGGVLAEAPDAPTDPSTSLAERWARMQQQAPAGARSAQAVHTPDPLFAPPDLPGELRTCGTTEAGGGYGWHIIENKGDVWQRIHWSKAPVSDEVRKLGVDAYPIATATGALCAYAVQEKPRAWRVRLVPSGKDVVAAPDSEHPPARCLSGGAVEVRRAEGVFLYAKDGAETKLPDSPAQPAAPLGVAALSVEGNANIARPAGPLRVRLPSGAVRELPLAPDHDLAGQPLAKGAIRERLLAGGDGTSRLLVVERIRMPDCSMREALHLVHVDTGEVATLSSGDIVYAKPVHAAGRFYWLEARPQTIDVTRGDGVQVSF